MESGTRTTLCIGHASLASTNSTRTRRLTWSYCLLCSSIDLYSRSGSLCCCYSTQGQDLCVVVTLLKVRISVLLLLYSRSGSLCCGYSTQGQDLCVVVTLLKVKVCVVVTLLKVRVCVVVTLLKVRVCVVVTLLKVRVCVVVTMWSRTKSNGWGGGGRCLCVVIRQWVFVCIIGGGAHSDKNARCGHTREEEGGQRWKDVCKREITEAGLKEGNTTNRAAWRNEIISYNGDPR